MLVYKKINKRSAIAINMKCQEKPILNNMAANDTDQSSPEDIR